MIIKRTMKTKLLLALLLLPASALADRYFECVSPDYNNTIYLQNEVMCHPEIYMPQEIKQDIVLRLRKSMAKDFTPREIRREINWTTNSYVCGWIEVPRGLLGENFGPNN